MTKPPIIKSGDRFTNLTVICFSHRDKHRNAYWFCRCNCGVEKLVADSHLRSGDTKSCGCAKRTMGIYRGTSHGMSKTPEYRAWAGMKDRCGNKNRNNYDSYGGRGILVCDRWLNSFENFYEDMGDKPEPKKDYTLERIDNEKGYSPDNCKWATWSEQAKNKRVMGEVRFHGVRKSKDGKKFRALINTNSKRQNLGTFDTALEAATAYDDKYEEMYGVRRNGT